MIPYRTSDKFYFDQLLAFLASLCINSPNDNIHVFLANYSEQTVSKLKRSFGKFVFENRELKMIDDRGFSLILFRIELIKECFEKYKEPVAWIDTDVLVRGELDSFLEIEPQQLKILFRGDQNLRLGVDAPINAGIFNLGCSKETYEFVRDWYSGCIKNPVWGQGQKILWSTYEKHIKNIKLIKMSSKLNDIGGRDKTNAFSSDSVMWHCKKNHFNNPKYQKEYQYYLKEGERLYH